MACFVGFTLGPDVRVSFRVTHFRRPEIKTGSWFSRVLDHYGELGFGRNRFCEKDLQRFSGRNEITDFGFFADYFFD